MKTKIIQIIFSIIILTTYNSYSQEFIPSLKAGLNMSSLQSSQIKSASKVGFDVGFNFSAVLGDKFDLISEFTLSRKGAKLQGRKTTSSFYGGPTLGSETFDYHLKINTGSWSVIANYYLKAPNFSLQAGPVFGYNILLPTLKEEEELYFGNSDKLEENISVSSLNDAVEGFDFSLAAGISGGTEALRINLRYYKGFTNYYKKMESPKGYTIKNDFIQLSLTYLFVNVRAVRGSRR